MQVNSANLTISAVSEAQYPKNSQPEFVFAGRSNVGKSSLINALLGRKNLAHTSSSPGKTQTLNFYHINEAFYFVDVPGYGYAKVSKKQREAFGQMIETYLTTRKQFRGLVLLMDSRHVPTEDDVLMFNYGLYLQKPMLVVSTKIDKIKPNQLNKVEQRVRSVLELDSPGVDYLTFSAVKKQNVVELWNWLDHH